MLVNDKSELISRAVQWYQDNGDAMIPNESGYTEFFDETPEEYETTQLYTVLDSSTTHGVWDVRRRLIPFLVAIGLEQKPDQLAKIIEHHRIQPMDLAEIMWCVPGAASLPATTGSFDLSDMHNLFYQAINTDQSLWPLARKAIHAAYLPNEAAAALLFFNDPEFWMHNRALEASSDKIAAIIESSAGIPTTVDVSQPKNWPDGNLNTFLERSGAYLERTLLNYTADLTQVEPSFWYNLLCSAPAKMQTEDEQTEYYRRIFQAVDPCESRFLRGIRSIYASYDGSQHLIFSLSRMLNAAEDLPHIKGALANELMLMRVTWDPANFDLFRMDLSRIHPSLILLFGRDQQGFIPRLCRQLLDLPIEEFNKYDLAALHAANLRQPDQPFPAIDAEKLVDHLMNAFAYHEPGYADCSPLQRAKTDIIRWIASSHEFTSGFLDSRTDNDLEVMALAGVQTHRRLSTQALGRVFSQDLGL
ncbi:hypothetical protein [Pseudomonas serbica]|uniref:hypothetical protein n=1 Tax=Pseudomonas serbica TaxID=2965074 RepID=UPI00237B42D9|nr:hypothetical protein [Pseudomonas serbica]